MSGNPIMRVWAGWGTAGCAVGMVSGGGVAWDAGVAQLHALRWRIRTIWTVPLPPPLLDFDVVADRSEVADAGTGVIRVLAIVTVVADKAERGGSALITLDAGGAKETLVW